LQRMNCCEVHLEMNGQMRSEMVRWSSETVSVFIDDYCWYDFFEFWLVKCDAVGSRVSLLLFSNGERWIINWSYNIRRDQFRTYWYYIFIEKRDIAMSRDIAIVVMNIKCSDHGICLDEDFTLFSI
jgi:hypothetical protein